VGLPASVRRRLGQATWCRRYLTIVDSLGTSELIVNVGCRNRALGRGDDHLAEPSNNIACRIQPRNLGLLVGIHLQGAVLIAACK
jgi:hypothetical protein